MAREVNLDTIRAEATREPLAITISGETFQAPSELPYPAFRSLGKLAGLQADDPAAMAPVLDTLDVVMSALIGPEAWERHAATLSSTDVLALLQAVLVQYGFADAGSTPEAALGERPASAP